MGDIASGFVASLAPICESCTSVGEAWEQVLPGSLRAHCRIGGLSGGCLRIVVDAASYMYELQLCKTELLRELQRLCPGTRLHRMQVTMARDRCAGGH
jgi:hypothetical protein